MSEPAVTPPWSEGLIAAALARQTFASKALVMVPNCTWTGHECDLLVVEPGLRLIEVEVKCSRPDLKRDSAKLKWWLNPWPNGYAAGRTPTRSEWPPKIWKHYYALPADLWKPELLAALPSSASGVLLLAHLPSGKIRATCERRAKPNRQAEKIEAPAVLNLARLASLRMWDVIQGRR